MLQETIKLALQALRRNAFRSFLTVLGIVIGVAAVIAMVTIGHGTREIGIRLAIGALERHVLLQFLVEGIVLSLFGGLVGIVVGLGLAAAAAQGLQIPFVFDPAIVVVAFLFSALVGVVFGYVPARRAAQMDPIEALRHE
jgi:putative ABC transport system permease protein